MNSRLCNPGYITIKEQLCCPDVELLVVGLRPYHLPREILYVTIVVQYIPPFASPTSACSTTHTTISKLQTQHTSALIIMSGDFYHVTMDTVLPTFKQYVSLPTREERTLDLMYANIKDAYISSSLPPLGRSDHNLVHLKPCYVPLVKRKPTTTRTVRRWSEEAHEALQGCSPRRLCCWLPNSSNKLPLYLLPTPLPYRPLVCPHHLNSHPPTPPLCPALHYVLHNLRTPPLPQLSPLRGCPFGRKQSFFSLSLSSSF